MSVTVRPYVNGGWEVDIRVELPDGTVIRERKKAPSHQQDRGATVGRSARAGVAGRTANRSRSRKRRCRRNQH